MSLGIKLMRMNLGMNLILYICLGIQKYIYSIQSIHMGVIWHNRIFQK